MGIPSPTGLLVSLFDRVIAVHGRLTEVALCEDFLAGPLRGGRGKVFPGPATFGGPPSLKNTEKGVPGGFFLTSNMHKIHFRPGVNPARGAYDSPQTPNRMVREHPYTPTYVSSLWTARSGRIRNEVVIGPHDNGLPGPAVAHHELYFLVLYCCN